MIDILIQFKNDLALGIVQFIRDYDDTPFFLDVAQIMEFAAEEQFETEGKYLGGRGPGSFGYRWFDLAPSTKESRKRINKWPGRVLQVTGQLASSFEASVSGSGVTIGTNKEYAPYLHFGTDRMPPRPLFASKLPQEVIEQIEDAFIQNWK